MSFTPPPEILSLGQLLFLGLVYLRILFDASNLISSGSELLILVPAFSGVVGSIILPIVGAVPDGLMILFSGLGENPQSTVAVGVGNLAGSTIMLLTVSWFAVIFGGRVSLSGGEPCYTQKLALRDATSLRAAIGVSDGIAKSAGFMLLSAVTYVLTDCAALSGRPRPEVALALCLGFLVWYLRREMSGELCDVRLAQRRVDAILQKTLSFRGALEDLLKERQFEQGLSERFLGAGELRAQFDRVLRFFFDRFDLNRDGLIDFSEFKMVMADLHESRKNEELVFLFKSADSDRSGSIDFDEFVEMTIRAFETPPAPEDSVPEDLTELPPAEQQRRVKIRAAWMMALGGALILAFTGPAVDVIAEVGVRTGVSGFYISFVFGPIASNASEIIAAYNYAAKKTAKSMEVALSSLIGAAILNNTFGLAVLLGLVWVKGLLWDFHAEVGAIVFVQLGVGLLAVFKRSHNLLDGLIILSLYPLSLLICFLFKSS